MTIKVSYDKNFKVTGIGDKDTYETTEPFILLDLTDEQFEELLNTPFRALTVNIEYNSIFSELIPEEPIEEISDVEKIKKELDEIKDILNKIKLFLKI